MLLLMDCGTIQPIQFLQQQKSFIEMHANRPDGSCVDAVGGSSQTDNLQTVPGHPRWHRLPAECCLKSGNSKKNCIQKHYLFNHSYLQIYRCCHHYCCASTLLLLLLLLSLLLLHWHAPNGVLPCR